jgi:hypothetical protein
VGRRGEVEGCQVSTTTTTSITTPLTTIPTLCVSTGGGAVTPQHPSPPSAAPLQPETEPRRLGFGIFTQIPSPPRASRPHDPTTTTASYVLPCHPDAPSPTAVSHGAPETEPQQLGFWFRPNPPPRLAFRERTVPPPPPPGTCHRAIPKHHPPSPFHTARPKPSHNGSVLGTSTETPPASRFAIARPHRHNYLVRTTTPPLRTHNHSATSSYHPPLLFGRPQTEPRGSASISFCLITC